MQTANASPPIEVKELGKVIELKAEPINAQSPIVFKELGKVIELRDVQSPYLQPIITQYFIDNKSEIWLLFLIAHSKR